MSTRQELAKAIESNIPFDGDFTPPEDGEDLPETGFLAGYVVIAEWHGSDGNRWLSRMSGDGLGERSLPHWQLKGYALELMDWEG